MPEVPAWYSALVEDTVTDAPVAPVAPVRATPKANSSVNSTSPSTVTGMVTLPGPVTAVVTLTVRVGEVASELELTLTPVGHTHLDVSTTAATASAPRIATTCVVQLAALAPDVVPGKV